MPRGDISSLPPTLIISDDARLARAERQLARTQTQLERRIERYTMVVDDLSRHATEIARLRDHNQELRAALTDTATTVADLHQQVAARAAAAEESQRALDLLLATRTMRLLHRPRQAYARLLAARARR